MQDLLHQTIEIFCNGLDRHEFHACHCCVRYNTGCTFEYSESDIESPLQDVCSDRERYVSCHEIALSLGEFPSSCGQLWVFLQIIVTDMLQVGSPLTAFRRNSSCSMYLLTVVRAPPKISPLSVSSEAVSSLNPSLLMISFKVFFITTTVLFRSIRQSDALQERLPSRPWILRKRLCYAKHHQPYAQKTRLGGPSQEETKSRSRVQQIDLRERGDGSSEIFHRLVYRNPDAYQLDFFEYGTV
jgi:hypothetical protein